MVDYQQFDVRPPALFDNASGDTECSGVFEILEPTELYMAVDVVEVSATAPSIAVQAEQSEDGVAWSELPTILVTITAAGYTLVASIAGFMRYLRIKYTNSVASSSAVFSLTIASKKGSTLAATPGAAGGPGEAPIPP